MLRKTVDTLILDLDNTLFDWVKIWHSTFIIRRAAILAEASNEHAVDRAIRKIHRRRRTSEYRFLIDELFASSRSSQASAPRLKTRSISKNLDESKQLYPNVLESLLKIKKQGTRIVACTESMELYTTERLQDFGLDGVIEILFCNEDHELPTNLKSICRFGRRPRLLATQVQYIEPRRIKPDAEILRKILHIVGANATRAAYVGDSLFRDVYMARQAGILDIHAMYGETNRRSEYELLKRVSHWTNAEIRREQSKSPRDADFKPTITLRSSFSDIFDFVDFVAFRDSGGASGSYRIRAK